MDKFKLNDEVRYNNSKSVHHRILGKITELLGNKIYLVNFEGQFEGEFEETELIPSNTPANYKSCEFQDSEGFSAKNGEGDSLEEVFKVILIRKLKNHKYE